MVPELKRMWEDGSVGDREEAQGLGLRGSGLAFRVYHYRTTLPLD